MPRSYWDYGVNPNAVGPQAAPELMELAARLGRINTYSRSGDVLWQDDFEDAPVKWLDGGTLAPSTWARSQDYARNGGWSLKFTPDATLNAYAIAYIPMFLPELGHIGFELHYAQKEPKVKLDFRFEIYDGATEYIGRIQWDCDAQQLLYFDSAGVAQVLASSIGPLNVYQTWNPVKLVVDSVTGKYVRLHFRDKTYDLSSYSMQSVASGLIPHLNIVLLHRTLANAANLGYVDDVIITQNEP